jgi:hypothetical protein
VISVKLECGADRMVFKIFDLAMNQIYEWSDDTARTERGKFIQEPVPPSFQPPNGTYYVQVEVWKGLVVARKAAVFAVLK